VPLGFLIAPIFVLLARPRPWTLAVGGVIGLLGLGLRAWASGHLRKNDALATTGPYAYTRNPLYLGSFLIGIGFTVAAGRWALALLFAALFLGIYVPVMRVESATLEELFGHKYRRYAQAVSLFIPRPRPYRERVRAQFDATLYKRYREYQAALGFVIAWTLLALKAWYFRD
jgi:protein-S-isoprenylcysteine O-methyltransferase Ste14